MVHSHKFTFVGIVLSAAINVAPITVGIYLAAVHNPFVKLAPRNIQNIKIALLFVCARFVLVCAVKIIVCAIKGFE